MIDDRITTEPAAHAFMPASFADRLEIRELLENWVLWRDAGDWDRFLSVWLPEGRMNATWFKASASDFVARSRKAFDGGMVGLHSLGGISIEVNGLRAISQTKMQIVQRGRIDDVEVDVVCQGRFLDALEKRDGVWRMMLRQPVYELDRMTAIDPSAELVLDAELLASFPLGYRHLAYLQTRMGFEVSRTLPGTRGPEIAALRTRMKLWLAGSDPSCLDD